MQRQSDDHILSGLHAGGVQEDRSLRELYRRELPRILNYVLQNQGSEEEGRDLFQDVLVVFLEHLREGRFRKEAAIGTYLQSIARRMWLNRLKRKGVAARFVDQHLQDEQPREGTPLQIMLHEEQQELFAEVMQLLGEKCRKLLEMKLYLQLSMIEIAAQLGFKNEQNARNKHYKCKSELRRIILENPDLRTALRGMR